MNVLARVIVSKPHVTGDLALRFSYLPATYVLVVASPNLIGLVLIGLTRERSLFGFGN
jgi:hypothetical protein